MPPRCSWSVGAKICSVLRLQVAASYVVTFRRLASVLK